MSGEDEEWEKTLCVQHTDREPDGWDMDPDTPYWICDCGHIEEQPFSFAEGAILLCGFCVLAGANRYWIQAGSGEYLTWGKLTIAGPIKRKAISGERRRKIFERDAYRCRYCGSYIDLVLDHLVPHIRTQNDSDENLVAACRICNSKKKDRTPEEAGLVLLSVPCVTN